MKPDNDEFKKKRQQFSINLRKANREDLLMKRRMIPTQLSTEHPQQKKLAIVDQILHTFLEQALNEQYDSTQLPQIAQLLKSQNVYDKHKAVIGLRKITSQMSEFIQEFVLANNLIRFLASWCDQSHYPQLRLQILEALTNLSSFSKQASKEIVQAQYIPIVSAALSDENEQIVHQAIWLAANLAVDDTKYRDELIENNAVMKIIQFLQGKRSKAQIITGTWALTNLARGTPRPKYDSVKFIGPMVAQSLISGIIHNQQILSDCLWTLSGLSDGSRVRVTRIMETNVLPVIMKYLSSTNLCLVIPALRIVGNFTSGNREQTNEVINAQFFDHAVVLINHAKPIIVKQTCWALSNITAGTDEQILRFLQRKDLIEGLLEVYPKHSSQVKSEIVWIFTNLQKAEIPQLILNLFEIIKLVDMIGQLLQQTNVKVLVDALICLHRVFTLAEKCRTEPGEKNKLVEYFMQQNYTQHLQKLQSNPSDKVYTESCNVIKRFFELDSSDGMVDEQANV